MRRKKLWLLTIMSAAKEVGGIANPDMETVANMKEIVPEYKSNHSVYEILDKK